MKILVVGGGGREHALAWKLAGEPGVAQVICAPGNPGIEQVARCLPADTSNPGDLLSMALKEGVDLTVVGPEAPLSLGLVDLFLSKGLPIVGPTRAAAALEWSKVFAKDFMARHRIPTARFIVCESAEDALALIARGDLGFPVVLKADGLAAGKGVIIAADRAEAEAAIRAMMLERRFGAAGDRIVVEEFLVGQEASYFVLADGTAFVTFSSAQDHKRIFDDDRGPNTGGMGAFAPSPLLTSTVETQVIEEIVRPVLAGMQREGQPYRGFLYVGLMLTMSGPKVVEFNVRFGDPEAQVVMPMLEGSLSSLLHAAATGGLAEQTTHFRSEPHVGVVIAAGGYPETPEIGRPIRGLDEAAAVPGALVFHAGTRRQGDVIVTSGGRVLTVVGSGPTYAKAIEVAYGAAAKVAFDGMQMRRDIGLKAVHGSRA
jgi:phosphoribosylamine--glycine ligase